MLINIPVGALVQAGIFCTTNPEWKQRDITGDGLPETFCNRSVEHVARLFGCRDLTREDGRPLSANEMCRVFETSPNWRVITTSYEDAQTLANSGRLLIAWKALPVHGHVAPLVPGTMKSSGSYKALVPIIANVGPAEWHGVRMLSHGFSFPKRPKISIYEPKGKP